MARLAIEGLKRKLFIQDGTALYEAVATIFIGQLIIFFVYQHTSHISTHLISYCIPLQNRIYTFGSTSKFSAQMNNVQLSFGQVVTVSLTATLVKSIKACKEG